jgi:hypothetical protein
MSQPWRKRGPHVVSRKFFELSYRLKTATFEASGLLDAGVPAKLVQTVIVAPNESSSATEHLGIGNLLLGRLFNMSVSQCGSTC